MIQIRAKMGRRGESMRKVMYRQSQKSLRSLRKKFLAKTRRAQSQFMNESQLKKESPAVGRGFRELH